MIMARLFSASGAGVRRRQPAEVRTIERSRRRIQCAPGSIAAARARRLEPISKLPTAVDRITMSNDSAPGRAVGPHPGSFSGGEYCRWASWAQTDSDPLCSRSGPVDTQHRRAMAHAAAELPELQNCASALSDLVPG